MLMVTCVLGVGVDVGDHHPAELGREGQGLIESRSPRPTPMAMITLLAIRPLGGSRSGLDASSIEAKVRWAPNALAACPA